MRLFLVMYLLLLVGAPLAAQAPALYTFETAPFILNATTPFSNVAPASGGPGGFTASFTNAPLSNGVVVSSGNFTEFGFSGQFLFVPGGAETMTVTFNTPIQGLIVNFAYNSSSSNSPSRFEAVVGANIYSDSGAILSAFPGGTLNFTNPTSFTSVDFRAFNSQGVQAEWALDNLSLQFAAVPEPTTWALIGVGTLGTAVYAWRKKRLAVKAGMAKLKV